jgi:vacuolar-type H+-ATPase subunit F/Vma7
MSNVLTDAEEEIERTAQEAAREVAAEDAGEITVQKSIAESWKKEAEKLDRENGFWKKSAILEVAVIAGGALVFALTH